MNWIDIRDEVPEHDGMLGVVFYCVDKPVVEVAVWDAQRRVFGTIDLELDCPYVTHWLPLPSHPKSKEWLEGFDAANKDEAAVSYTPDTFTHNPYQPTSPYTYPDYHCGPPTKEAAEWEAGYEYRQFEHQRRYIRLKVTVGTGGGTIETYFN